MQKRRRSAFALPAGILSRNENIFSLEDVRRGSVCPRQKNGELSESLSTSKKTDPCTRTSPNSKENWPRRRFDSVTSFDSHARRKNSFQLVNFSSRTHNFLHQDTESHQAVVLGSPGVGKTALIVRHVTGRFVHEYDPTLEMTYEKLQVVGNVKGILRIMDTAGSIEHCFSYIRKAEGIIVVYSITDRYSFEAAKDYLKTIKDYARLRSPFDYELPTILVGNKRELRRGRQVSRDEARRMAEECGCLFVESSAACDRNVKKIFTNLFLQIHRIKEERQRTISSNTSGFVSSVRNFFQSKKKMNAF